MRYPGIGLAAHGLCEGRLIDQFAIFPPAYWLPLPPFCLSSSNLALIDSPVLVLDDIEDFTRTVAFEAANGFEFEQTFCDTTRHIWVRSSHRRWQIAMM